MDSERIAGLILDIGVAMIQSGAETHRVEDSLYRLCASYGFEQCNIWVVPSNIQASLTTRDGKCLTQIRHVRGMSVNFDRLDRLNALSRALCAETPDADGMAARFEAASAIRPEKPWVNYLAGILAAAGFGVFFNCDFADMAAAILAAMLITFFGRRLSKRENNPLILNFLIAFAAELFIMFCVHVGLGHHMGCITVGVVMLLISALGTTNGVRDLVHLDTLSGTMNITQSLTGAIGIALGIALALNLFSGWNTGDIGALNPSVALQLVSCTIGCAGFALWFHVRRGHIAFCALGALLTWAAYLAASRWFGAFMSTVAAAGACGLFAQVAARVKKAPATIFMTIGVFPLIPGAALYYTMAGIVMRDHALALRMGGSLVLTCFGIVLGFMAVEVASRYIWRTKPIGK